MALPILDVHMHLAALDPAASDGGWFPEKRKNSPVFKWIRRKAGLPMQDEGFDQAFADLARRLVAQAGGLAEKEGFAGFCGVGLAFDRPHDQNGEPQDGIADFYVPDAYALRLAATSVPVSENTTGSRLLAGASIHPYRRDALETLAVAADKGAALVKWLPTAQGMDPTDSRSAAFAAECLRLGLPLLIHTGSEAATRNSRPDWNNPRSLEPLLDTGATIIAAHAGMRSLPHERNHFAEWTAMLPHWPNLHGDTSSLFGFRPRTLVRALDKPLVADRLVHGSDWPVPNWPGWYWPGLGLGTIRRLAGIANPLWRDAATKRAAGIPEDSFVRGWDLLNASKA